MEDFELSAEEEKEVLRLANLYKREAEKCYNAKAYLAGCVLIGAAMEAVLLSAANCFPEIVASAKCAPKEKGKIKRLNKWVFAELLRVAKELNWLPSGLSPEEEWNIANAEIGDYVEVVRHFRNLIHPARYANDFARKRVTKKYYEACFSVVNTAVDYLLMFVKNSLKMLVKEKRRRDAQQKLQAESSSDAENMHDSPEEA